MLSSEQNKLNESGRDYYNNFAEKYYTDFKDEVEQKPYDKDYFNP